MMYLRSKYALIVPRMLQPLKASFKIVNEIPGIRKIISKCNPNLLAGISPNQYDIQSRFFLFKFKKGLQRFSS